MEKLLNYYRSENSENITGLSFQWLLILIALLFNACQPSPTYYKKDFTEEEKLEKAELLLSGLGYRYYYQGSTGEQELLAEAAMHNINHAEVWRERGIPYLKRGIASGYYEPYKRCAELDPVQWQGYKGYCTLYFYRDYESALKDFDELDALTPNFLDYPQATSIDYMRAICYSGMDQPKKALAYIDQHIELETKEVGIEYVNTAGLVLKAKAHLALDQKEEAQLILEKGVAAHNKNADLEFYLAQLLFENGEKERAKELAEKAKRNFKEGYFNMRPYVEEFYQIYLIDIEELLTEIGR